MAFRITSAIVRGEIDNRVRGRVTGRIWLEGRELPLLLTLQGNCWRDLAGCLTRFENPRPEADYHVESLVDDQSGEVGDITASRKVRVLEVPVDVAYMMAKRGEKAPEHWGNALYLEWFSQSNGRVVVESADFQIEVSLPEWQMTDDEERRQREGNAGAMQRFMGRLTDRLENARRDCRNACEAAGDRPLDEFGWEKVMRNSDAVTDKHLELLDKYGHTPEAEQTIAREMGWLTDEDEPPGDAKRPKWEKESFEPPDEDDLESYSEPEPDPAREGIDWIKDEDGDVVHPLVDRARRLGLRLYEATKSTVDAENDACDSPPHDLAFQIQLLGAKFAGSLHGLVDGHPDSGFIVATLKRTLPIMDKAFALLLTLEQQPPALAPELLAETKTELFAIREAVLALMEEHRRQC